MPVIPEFSPKFSGAVAMRYIRSDLTQGQEVQGQSTKAGQSVAADVAMYYTNEMNVSWLYRFPI